MLKRKITQAFDSWASDGCKKALFVDGARQVGKTTSIREFAKKRFKNYIEVNFVRSPRVKEAFSGELDADTIKLNLSAMGLGPFEKGKTVLFLDEIQECPSARASVKFLVEDGEIAIIESGSMLGVNFKSSITDSMASIPVGSEHHIHMYPLDFEEFLWANGINSDVIDTLRISFNAKRPVQDFIHKRIMDIYAKYLIVGGLPEVDSTFAENPDFSRTLSIQKDLIAGYRRDISRSAGKDSVLVNRIFDSVPSQLAKQDKRFVLAEIEKGASRRKYDDPAQWLIDAGMVYNSNHINAFSLPFANVANPKLYKLYFFDTGIVSCMSLEGKQFDVLNGELDANNGALTENFIADELRRKGIGLHYFDQKSKHEVDFVFAGGNGITALEVKSGNDYTSHASLDYAVSKYGNAIDNAIVLCKSNIEESDGILYLPLYMAMFL